MYDDNRELLDEIERRVKDQLSALESLRNPAVWLKLLLAPLVVVIATWFLQCQTEKALEPVRMRLALNQEFYKVQLGKLQEGYRLVSEADNLVGEAVVTPSIDRTRALRRGVVELQHWLAAHEFFLSDRSLAAGTELTNAGLTIFRDLEQGDHKEAKSARTIWNECSTRMKQALRREARVTDPQEMSG
jgi:hypothetical protein